MIVPIIAAGHQGVLVDMFTLRLGKPQLTPTPSCHSMDPEMKEELIMILEKLLADRTTLVIGSAVTALRRFVRTRSSSSTRTTQAGQPPGGRGGVGPGGHPQHAHQDGGRTQFADPNHGVLELDDEEEEKSSMKIVMMTLRREVSAESAAKPVYKMDPDLFLLLRSAKPLLKPRNASVVMATAGLYWHPGPRAEIAVVARSVTRLLQVTTRSRLSPQLHCIDDNQVTRRI